MTGLDYYPTLSIIRLYANIPLFHVIQFYIRHLCNTQWYIHAMVPLLIEYFFIRPILLNQPQSKVGQSCANNKESDLMGGLSLGPSKHNQIRKQMLQPLCYDSLFKKRHFRILIIGTD